MMPHSQQSLLRRWQETRRRHHAEREWRAALVELSDHLRKDIGLQPRCCPGEPWL